MAVVLVLIQILKLRDSSIAKLKLNDNFGQIFYRARKGLKDEILNSSL